MRDKHFDRFLSVGREAIHLLIGKQSSRSDQTKLIPRGGAPRVIKERCKLFVFLSDDVKHFQIALMRALVGGRTGVLNLRKHTLAKPLQGN